MTNDLVADLRDAIDHLYAVFARYPRPAHIDVCEQCYPEMPGRFATTELRDITADMLSQYHDARSCHGYSSNMDDDMRYLLPRWLALIADGAEIGRWGDGDGLVVVAPAHWRARWPAGEAEALDRYCAALLRHEMAKPVEIEDMGSGPFLRGRDLEWFRWTIGSIGGAAVLPLLRIAETLPGRDMDIRIAALAASIARGAVDAWERQRNDGETEPFDPVLAVLSTDEELGARCPCNRCEQKARAWEWLAQAAFRERLEAATLAESDPQAARILSRGEQIVGALVRARAELPAAEREWQRFRRAMHVLPEFDYQNAVPHIERGLLFYTGVLSFVAGSGIVPKMLAHLDGLSHHIADQQIASAACALFPNAVLHWSPEKPQTAAFAREAADARAREPAVCDWLARPAMLDRLRTAGARSVSDADKVLFSAAGTAVTALMRPGHAAH